MTNKRRKSPVGEWRRWHRFRRFQNFTKRLFLTTGLLSLLVIVLIRTTGAQHPKELAQALNSYSNLALALFAFVTAGATLAYAHLTRSILLEMTEARRAEVRPFVRVTFQDARFTSDAQHKPPRLYMDVAVKVSNYGRGKAVGVRTHITVPYALGESGVPKDWIGADVGWTSPPVLEAPGELVGELHLVMLEYNLPETFREFLELEARYEDAQQGLHCLRQYYDLSAYGAPERKTALTLRYEALYYFPYERRKSISDTDMRLLVTWDEAPVYERGIPWSY